MSAAKLFAAILTALLIFTTVSLTNFNPFSSQLAHSDRQTMPVAHAQAPPSQKILVDASDEETLKELATSGATRLADYGAFSLWRVSSSRMATMSNRAALLAQPDFDLIPLRGGGVIQTGQGGREPTIPNKLRQVPGEEFEFGLVQFIGPVKDQWLAALTKSGLELVIYLPHNAYVVWGRAANQTLARLAASQPFIQWTGPYHPAYRLEPGLQQAAAAREAGELVEVTVQFYRTRNTPASLARLLQLGGAVRKSPEDILGFTNITLALPAGRLIEVAAWPDVFNVEPWTAPELLDEIQNQIIAGNVISASGVISPSGPGYLAWLSAMGFPTTTTSYPVVDIMDDGIDQGNANNVLDPDFHEFGSLANPDRVLYIVNCTTDPSGNGRAGHGHLNMGIVGSYNNLAGAPHVDAAGYRRGLGVSPYGRLAGTKIFRNNGAFDSSACGGTDQGVVAASYNNGANFTSNSWGAPVEGVYDAAAQTYDALTRDAHGPTAGNQQMLHIFSAGNDGPNPKSIGSPGTAKNVLTVGATENVRDEGVIDGLCGEANANNSDDLATFSSRGPLDDNRVKPDIVAPGTHIQGPASKDPGFNGNGVCGGPDNDGVSPATDAYYPSGQTRYTWSSGTSHSTPAIAGAASLTWEYYKRVLNPGQTPSPAMLKALLLNSSRYLNGSGTSGTLPSNKQGWGGVNLGMLVDGVPRRLLDQSVLFSQTGQIYTTTGQVVSTAKPFRASLVWTDAPGPTVGDAYVNDLDLEVTVGGQTYKGNIFIGATSITGGSNDFRNNVENVFVPAGASGPYSVRVIARNLAGDGLPGNGDPTDQDFALVIYNGDNSPQTVLAVAGLGINDAAGGNSNGVVDPGETIRLEISLANYGALPAVGVNGQVAATGGQVTMLNDTSPYAAIAATAVVTNTIPYTFAVSPDQLCGQLLMFTFTATHSAQPVAYTFSIPVGQVRMPLAENFDSLGAPALPAGWTTSATGAQIPWITLSNNSDTLPNHAFAPNPEEIGLSELTTPVFSITTTSAQLIFRNSYDLEDGFDGGVLEIKIGPLAFTDILTAGGSFVSGGYNDTLNSSFDNPLSGRQAWSGSFSDYQTTVVNLPAAAAGQPVQLRWQVGTDAFISATGQRIDTISVTDGIICTPPLPDLALTKSVSSNPAAASAPLTYTLRVDNIGPAITTTVTVTDTLPAGVAFNSVAGAGWSCNNVGSVITCTRANLAPGVAPDILIATTPLITNGLITNTAAVTTPTDTNSANNTATITTTVTPPVDLAITKAASPTLARPGQGITYTLIYTNNGPNPATGVIITDIVPVSITNPSYDSSGAAITVTGSVNFSWQVANLLPEKGGVITLTGVLSHSLSSGASFTNTATIASAGADVNMSNNTSAVGVMVTDDGGSLYLPVILK